MPRLQSSRTLLFLLLAFGLVAASGCEALRATRVGQPSTLSEALNIYRNAKEKKAIAIAVDENGKRTWGALYPAKLQSWAGEQAIEECERNVRQLGIRAECWLFAEGDEPAKETILACRQGRPNPRRCALQDRFFQLYPR